MRLTIAAVGRLKRGPEAALVEDYLSRCSKTGRALGLGPAQVIEVEDRKGGGMAAEAALLAAKLLEGAKVVVLDERGAVLASPVFATRLAGWRDDGVRDTVFVIGGADGVDASLRERADLCLSFGKMVWPHMLVRVMVAEQLYRATTILAGGPYHRE
ncbi:MAG: 23S rRNA (pseudouridine(1915)-N(3))-methyltransferase RlmH [Pseudomonadota bacterium]